jgi:hypothetical protein
MNDSDDYKHDYEAKEIFMYVWLITITIVTSNFITL